MCCVCKRNARALQADTTHSLRWLVSGRECVCVCGCFSTCRLDVLLMSDCRPKMCTLTHIIQSSWEAVGLKYSSRDAMKRTSRRLTSRQSVVMSFPLHPLTVSVATICRGVGVGGWAFVWHTHCSTFGFHISARADTVFSDTFLNLFSFESSVGVCVSVDARFLPKHPSVIRVIHQIYSKWFGETKAKKKKKEANEEMVRPTCLLDFFHQSFRKGKKKKKSVLTFQCSAALRYKLNLARGQKAVQNATDMQMVSMDSCCLRSNAELNTKVVQTVRIIYEYSWA